MRNKLFGFARGTFGLLWCIAILFPLLTAVTSSSQYLYAGNSTAIVKALVVAGGGIGGRTYGSGAFGGGGGGGGGGYQENNSLTVTAQAYTVTVGAGQENSSFSTMTANAGGDGGDGVYSGGGGDGGAGGSGAGGSFGHNGGAGNQGNNGGNSGYYGAAGGGGAGTAGATTSSGFITTGGVGGAGKASTISGSSVIYAGGGGGGGSSTNGNGGGSTGGVGGAGGGGSGGAGNGGSGRPGTNNTGGGGGGGGDFAGSRGEGGSGIVIISYVTADFGDCAGGTKTTDGANTVHTFTSSGTFTVVLPAATPTVTTSSATNVTSDSATLNGTANANGLSTSAWFNYGITSGTYTGTTTTQSVSGSSDTSVSSDISGLSSNTTYYYRIAASNSTGTSYGSESSFTTTTSSTTNVIQPGSEGKDTCYGTVYAINGTPDAGTLYMGGLGDWYYDFFEFDLSGSPSANDTASATLYLYGNAPSDGSDPEFQVYRINESWTESGVTYSSNPASIFYKNFGSFAVSSSPAWNSVDITDLYKSWKSGTYPNYGIKLVPTKNNHTNGSIYSSDNTDSTHRPKLVIVYSGSSTTPTPTPTPSDTNAPNGSVSINSGASYTNSTSVTLTLSATDSVGVVGYYASTSSSTPVASASGWNSVTSATSYSWSVSYTLASGDEQKTVYVWYKDAAGNVSSTASDSIILDTTAPIVTITSPTSSDTYTTTSSPLSLDGSASDGTSGVKEVTWSNDKGVSGTASGTTYWSVSSISLTSGDNKITVTAKDNAGNTSTDTITVTYKAGKVPTVTTGSATNITENSATLNGTVNANGLTTTAWFSYGTNSGSYTHTSSTQTISGSSDTTISISISGLTAGTKYYYTLAAQNSAGTSTGSEVSFTTKTASATPTPTTSPTPTLPPLPTPAPTLPPLPTPQVSPSPVQEGIVFGFVNDQDEQPLKGVTVTIVGANGRSPLQNSTETDENGYYEFSGLAKGDYTLTYKKEGFLAQTQDISLEEGELKDLGTVTMEQVVKGKISGYVLNIKGDPIESVRLKLKGIKTKVIKTASSDADGFFEFTDLEADTYVIIAKKKKYRNTQQKVKLEEGASEEIEIEMKKTSRRVIEMMEDGQ